MGVTFNCNNKACVTCRHWKGPRRKKGNIIEVDSSTVKGECREKGGEYSANHSWCGDYDPVC